ncbi:hypothetical protein ACP275_11G073600 [Erythranthe tilingii]
MKPGQQNTRKKNPPVNLVRLMKVMIYVANVVWKVNWCCAIIAQPHFIRHACLSRSRDMHRREVCKDWESPLMLLKCINGDFKAHSSMDFLALKAECNSRLAVAITILQDY